MLFKAFLLSTAISASAGNAPVNDEVLQNPFGVEPANTTTQLAMLPTMEQGLGETHGHVVALCEEAVKQIGSNESARKAWLNESARNFKEGASVTVGGITLNAKICPDSNEIKGIKANCQKNPQSVGTKDSGECAAFGL